tara:strand:+ start:384 stop:620 length:237 start_codon:yes stop_codon:yes gene_type:complete
MENSYLDRQQLNSDNIPSMNHCVYEAELELDGMHMVHCTTTVYRKGKPSKEHFLCTLRDWYEGVNLYTRSNDKKSFNF